MMEEFIEVLGDSFESNAVIVHNVNNFFLIAKRFGIKVLFRQDLKSGYRHFFIHQGMKIYSPTVKE